MDQKNKKETKHESSWRHLFAAVALCAAVCLLGDLAAWIVHWMGGISFAVNRAATIGIIGGADGPTAVFLTSSTAPLWHTVLKLLLLIIGILGWRHLKRKQWTKGEE